MAIQSVTTSTVTVGVLDSGFGALSVLKCLRATLPNHHFLCVSDTKNAPYGAK
jgi:glutamate racemase